jgi:hypothetical protein
MRGDFEPHRIADCGTYRCSHYRAYQFANWLSYIHTIRDAY